MADSKALKRLVGGGLVAALMLVTLGDGDALAARKKRRAARGKSLVVQRINVAGSVNVPGNQIIEITFNNDVDAATIGAAYVQIRAENATQTGFTRQVFGTFQVDGNVVRFYPRLPTHLRDPSNASGGFYPQGSDKDNAGENAGLQPSTAYEIRLMGANSLSPIRSTRGRPLRNTISAEFSTASASDPAELYTTSSFQDSPPPQYAFSNPPDRVPSVDDQYTRTGGTQGVPADVAVSVFCTKVPLSPTTARIVGNVELTQTERNGSTDGRRPIGGSVFIEQNYATTLLVHQPTFPLADRATYALRIRKSVKDLTEQYDFANNRQRERLRAIYDWLANSRADNPGTPPGDLADPPAELIPDWPDDPAERAILKENVLIVGDTRPDEVDPRVIVMFTTRDEPVSNAALVINFNRAEDLYDARISTAEWDQTVPGAASAIMTVAAGDGSDGDFLPEGDTTLNGDLLKDATVNWRRVIIPQGVTVTVTGSRAVTLRALEFDIQGRILADGEKGDNAPSSYQTSPSSNIKGGKGGPGGGVGGDTSNKFPSTSSESQGDGKPGSPGVDEEGIEAIAEDGGRGGQGGIATRGSTYYGSGGGGGGGGARTAGGNGADGTSPSYNWAGKGGAGGEGSTNDDLVPLVGGAGGGSGANGGYAMYIPYGIHGGAGGGGGGALRLQTAGILKVGAGGLLGARGGDGGKSGQYSAGSGGPGAGGGGGSLLLQSSAGFAITSPADNLDVMGGKGATQSAGSYGYATNGGDGGTGYIRLEDPTGGMDVPGMATGGTFDPIGGGVPSLLYSKFADLGVQDPRILSFVNDDIVTVPTSNDAIFIEIQMTREHPALFGEPDLSAIDNDTQQSTDTSITSSWLPAKVHDNTGIPGGAFKIPGYNPSVQGSEYSFDISQLNDKGFRFVRFRITFQLDDFQSRTDPIPFVDKLTFRFQFNF